MPAATAGTEAAAAAGEVKEPETVVLPAAQLQQLKLLEGDWKEIIGAVGLTAKDTLKDVILEPQDEGRLLLVFHDLKTFDLGSRDSVLRSVESYIASAYQLQVRLTARLVAAEEYVGKRFVTEDELKQKINIDIIME